MFIEFCFDFWIFMVMCLWGTGLLATDFIWRSENSWQSIRDNISHRVAECLKLLADIIMRKTPGVRDKDFAPLFLSHAFGTKHRTESTDFFPESVWAQGSSNSGGLWNIFSSSHLLIFPSSHSLLLSCPLAPSFFSISLEGAGQCQRDARKCNPFARKMKFDRQKLR
jgi:hypothetical protein